MFLSPEWIELAEQIYRRHRHNVSGRGFPAVVVNLVVTSAPFAAGEVEAHTDTTCGDLLVRRGKASAPDLTFRLDYETARSLTQLPTLLTSLNLGSLANLAEADPIAARIAEELRGITA